MLAYRNLSAVLGAIVLVVGACGAATSSQAVPMPSAGVIGPSTFGRVGWH
jgi:hypothetical protein